MIVAGSLVHSHSINQPVIQLSSGEVEVRTINMGATECVYIRQVMDFMGMGPARSIVETDSAAAK